MGPHHKIVYLYRDAGNYKFWGEFVVAGDLSLNELQPHLLDEQFFIPQRIGIPSLTPEIWNGDDHMFHEFHSIQRTNPAAHPFTAAELINRIAEAHRTGWL